MSKTVDLSIGNGAKNLDLKEKLYLEDFYDDTDNSPTESLEVLTLSISFDNGSPAENEALYTRAVQNLKKLAPNLKAVHFNGGYVYNPIDDNSEAFRKEIMDLRNHFDSLNKIFKNQELPVAAINFRGTQVFDQYSINEAFHSDLIHELFGHQMSEQEMETYSTQFTYTPNEIPFQIQLFFNVKAPSNNNEPKNRRRCFLLDNICINV